MRTIAFSGLLLISLKINAQISLTSSDFADGGDTVRMSQTNDPSIDYFTTGPNQTWDFSSLVASSQVLKDFTPMTGAGTFALLLFGPFASPSYQASYFINSSSLPLDQIAQLAGLPIEAFDQVSKVSSTGVTSIGNILTTGGTNFPVKSDTIEVRYQLPLTYNQNYFSRGYTNLDLNPIQNAQWIQHRSRSVEADGYGIISTPLGTFNALRIHHLILETDSLYIDFNGFGTWIPIPVPAVHEYEWWTNGQKEPLLRISTSEFGGNQTVTAIEYRDIYRGMDAGILENDLKMVVYPNPTSDMLLILADGIWDKYVITDASGKLISMGQYSQWIDVIDLSQGSYFITLHKGPNKKTKLFIKE